MNVWDWEPSVVIGCAALAIVYFAIAHKHDLARAPYFLVGIVLLLLDLVSPIDALGDQYLLSAHVVQHFLLALVIPPLFLLGMPAFELRSLAPLERAIGQPPVSWILGVGAMLAWHIPALFNATLASDALHIVQHVSFLISGTIFWWPIVGPLKERHLPAFGAVTYLFSACTACSLLGAFLTFGPVGLYPAYLNPPQPNPLGLAPKSDQQLAGLLMWVPGCFVYLSAILVTVKRWYGAEQPAAEQPGAERPA